MRECRINLEELAGRRKKLADAIGEDSAFLLFANPEQTRNYDVHFPYRQDSSFYYFTGFEEPESVMLFRPGQNPEYTLFVRPKDPLRETWDGFRFGPEGAKEKFAADEVFLIDQLDEKLAEMLGGVDKIYHHMNVWEKNDAVVLNLIKKIQVKKGRAATAAASICDSREVIGSLRLIKQESEIENMRKASLLSAQAHLAAMKFVRPGVNERQVEAVLEYMFKMGGAARQAYTSIVASGANATCLHYNFNDQECRDGDLLLIDAGAEFEYYAGDITRTFPVNGKFTDSQKTFYNVVLEVQKEIVDMIRPGLDFTKLQEVTTEFLVDGLLELGLLDGKKSELIEAGAQKKYYPHGVSHFLGMDVHDIGTATVDGEPLKLKEGMCFTVEPGLYVPLDDESAPEEFRGLGVRIEDDIFVTEGGYENMTQVVPKDVEGIEEVMAESVEAGM